MSTVSTRTSAGWSLAKAPVAIIGILGIAYGVSGLISGAHGFAFHDVPHGTVPGRHWLGLEVNGWSNLLFVAGGLLLLLGSAAHWGAKSSAFIVAVVLGAAAVIGAIRGNGIFGIFAADHATEIVWGAAAVLLVVLSRLPRVGGRTVTTPARASRDPGLAP